MSSRQHSVTMQVQGPWSLATSRAFWEGFAPAALPVESAVELPPGGSDEPVSSTARPGSASESAPGSPPVSSLAASSDDDRLHTVFRTEHDWQPVAATVTQHGETAHIEVRATASGSADVDLDAAVTQVARFLSLDIDARGWVDVGRRDPVIGRAQQQLPGFRPCGFHSPYEAAAWAVLSQRIRVSQAAVLRQRLIAELGDDGAFPAPSALLAADLDLPGRKAEYLGAVAEAALSGLLDGAALRALDPAEAIERVQQVKGLGPFAAELVVIRGSNAPDALPLTEPRLRAEVAEQYGSDRDFVEISEGWRPFRSWASVHLRALRGMRG